MNMQPLTVGQLTRLSREALEQTVGYVWVRGELTALSTPTSGHWYFTLKDELGQLSCALFKPRVPKTSISVGSEVIVHGLVTLYEMRGQYQMIVDDILQSGVGYKYLQFEALKNKLYDEGLLDQRYKKSLPKYPRRIAIISSWHAAGLQDVLVILKRRYPLAAVKIYHSLVQGDEAVPMLLDAIERVQQDNNADVVMLVRGGGSYEDLWCFNDEKLARAIFAFTIPVITGIGHEIDTTIADLVADVRAPTPSAAAELVVIDARQLLVDLELKKQRIATLSQGMLKRLWFRVDALKFRKLPLSYLLRKKDKLMQLDSRLYYICAKLINNYWHRLELYHSRLLRVFDILRHRITLLRSKINAAVNNSLGDYKHKVMNLVDTFKLLDPTLAFRAGWAWIGPLENIGLGCCFRVYLSDCYLEVELKRKVFY